MNKIRKPAPCRTHYQGGAIVQLIGVVFVGFLVSALSIDFGFYFSAQNQLQTASDAASLAAASRLFTSTANNAESRQDESIEEAIELGGENTEFTELSEDDVTFGYIDPETKTYNVATFTTPSADPDSQGTDGYNAVLINGTAAAENNHALPGIIAKMAGIQTMDTYAHSVAMLDNVLSEMTGGLRPIYACKAQFDLAMADKNPRNNVARVYGQNFYLDGNTNIAGCPPAGSGNWGFADLRNADPNAPGANDTSEWFEDGYPHTVTADTYYSTQSGNFLSNHGVQQALNTLISNQTVITIPLINNDYTGSGSNTNVRVVGFTGFVITGFRPNGQAHQRYIEGYFTKVICNDAQCKTGKGGNLKGGGVAKLRLIQS